EALDNLGQSIKAYREAEQGLAASYGVSAIRDLDPEALDRQWREASASFWPNAMLGKRKVQKLLQSYADQGTAEPERDIPRLRRMRECLSAVDQNLLAGKPLPVDGLDTDLDAVADIIALAHELRGALRIPGREQEELRSIVQSVATCLRGTVENDTVRQAGDKLLAAIEGLETEGRHFSEISGRDMAFGRE